MLQKYIEVINPYIIELFKDDSSGHDISHLIRTMNIAVNLCKKELSVFLPICMIYIE
jgi:HD superfamily phosphodiesterase